jgi:Mn2+/Fe2+ NRAMP family transporter
MSQPPRRNPLTILGPGILVAATGVGAGDLATGAIAGSKIGVAILWAVVIGAVFKFILNEGLARWQLATGSTLLEGTVKHLGKLAGWLFLPYLLLWSYLVAMALMGACGVTAHAIYPIFENATHDKILYGILHSVVAVGLIAWGGYRLFEKLMSLCIAVMFLVVVITAVALRPDWSEVLSGIVWPTVPDAGGVGWKWTVGLIGGVGGTVTVLCYGYWIREEGRTGAESVKACRLDLAVGYTMTALFGLAMVIIGDHITIQGKGANLLVNISTTLDQALGPVAKWAFLIGGWSAVFSSMMGVWQSVPYLFADLCDLLTRQTPREIDKPPVFNMRSPYYLGFLLAIASLPVIGLALVSFSEVQGVYAICGAAFIPLLALVLLLLCTRAKWMGAELKNRWYTNVALGLMLVFFAYSLWRTISE